MIQLDQGCVYNEQPIATARFCDQNKVCTLSLLLKIQAFKNSYSDWSHMDLFLRLWKIISFNLEVNSSESWRLILGAETLGWISLNYLSIRFISIHIIHIRFVWWTTWGWPWSERFPWTRKVRSTTGTMESATWPAPKDILHVKWEFNELFSCFRWILFHSPKTLDYLNNKRKKK